MASGIVTGTAETRQRLGERERVEPAPEEGRQRKPPNGVEPGASFEQIDGHIAIDDAGSLELGQTAERTPPAEPSLAGERADCGVELPGGVIEEVEQQRVEQFQPGAAQSAILAIARSCGVFESAGFLVELASLFVCHRLESNPSGCAVAPDRRRRTAIAVLDAR